MSEDDEATRIDNNDLAPTMVAEYVRAVVTIFNIGTTQGMFSDAFWVSIGSSLLDLASYWWTERFWKQFVCGSWCLRSGRLRFRPRVRVPSRAVPAEIDHKLDI